MKKYAGKMILVAAAAMAFASMSATATAGDMYALGSVGVTTPSDSLNDSIQAITRGTGVTASNLSNGTGFKLMLGYQVNENFAVEGGFIDMGKLTTTLRGNGQSLDVDAKASGLNLSLLGILPLNDKFSSFVKVGYTNAKTESSAGTSSSSETKSSTGFGVGANYKLSETTAVRAEWERLYEDIYMTSISLKFKF